MKMSKRRMEQRARAILRVFDRASAGDPYGWDWPTMSVLFPELVAEFDTIKAEWRRRYAS